MTGDRVTTGDDGEAVERFRTLLRIPTMSNLDPSLVDEAAFAAYRDALERLYPALHGELVREVVGGGSLLYRWAGDRSDADSPPATVLMAHYDVVAATDEGWEHPPFGAVVTGTVTGSGAQTSTGQLLWGRGTLDNKGSGVAILEAVERSVRAGLRPASDVYLFFGHDEETEGTGALAAAELLAARGVRIGLVLDEGGAVVEKVFPTVERPIAVVGVAEKGTSSFTLTVQQNGGHASTPPRDPATNRLARAMVRLAKHPFPSGLNAVTARMIATVGAEGRDPLRFVFTRVGVFRPLIVAAFERLGVDTAAMVRTTMAVTQLSGSLAANALAERAQAVVNVRIAIGSTVDATRRHLERAIADPLVAVEILSADEPSPVSEMDGPVWELLAAAVSETYPEAIVTPYVQTGATDSRRFAGASRTVYRFSPFEMSTEERGTLHAKNERIRVATWLTGIRFYEGLLRRL
ncbi:M20/M25/M40 family metallo-hydrolase [Herbiconiux solani]|uniref:M20/M25/M40 family metallo-hydrolase n=1 Tax=Herbiconiux solani TaxID=661329 RepID=UPI000826027D|nr:M20/M25/M40 family metallo-hydrolase [Herbiconiux solani]